MEKLKVLNLYAGIGGNRKLWEDVEVTAVELDPQIAKIYQDFFPDDTVIVDDAHQYLLDHFKEYDFIWSSPPCKSHSTARWRGTFRGDTKIIYPDMNLYQEILLLQKYYGGLWTIENVKGFYEPLIKPIYLDRHYFWANFHIRKVTVKTEYPKDKPERLKQMYGINGNFDRELIRNCTDPRIGLHILNCALSVARRKRAVFKQPELWDVCGYICATT